MSDHLICECNWISDFTDQILKIQPNELGQFSGNDDLVRLSDGSGYFSTVAWRYYAIDDLLIEH